MNVSSNTENTERNIIAERIKKVVKIYSKVKAVFFSTFLLSHFLLKTYVHIACKIEVMYDHLNCFVIQINVFC